MTTKMKANSISLATNSYVHSYEYYIWGLCIYKTEKATCCCCCHAFWGPVAVVALLSLLCAQFHARR